MQPLDGIPTAPNSPAFSRVASVEPHGDARDDHAMPSDFSDFDMMSSIESLPREPWPRNAHLDESLDRMTPERPLATPPPATPKMHHGFIMPSMPSLSELSIESMPNTGLVGRLHLAICGGGEPHRVALIDVLSRDFFEPPLQPFSSELSAMNFELEHCVCSSSPREHNNVTLVNCGVSAQALPAWLEAHFREAANSALQPTIDALAYLFSAEPTEEELEALADAQKFVAIVPLVYSDVAADTDALRERMHSYGLSPFLKRVWTVATGLGPNWDMSASAVEASGYRSQVLQPSELPQMVNSLLRASGRARAHTSHLYARWVQAQLALTSQDPPGALVVRIDLRKSLESIGNLDPLGLAHWSTMPRLIGAVIAGMAAAVGLSAAWTRLFPVVPVTPVQCHRQILFGDMLERWTEWLMI